jgi:hypothetical protein
VHVGAQERPGRELLLRIADQHPAQQHRRLASVVVIDEPLPTETAAHAVASSLDAVVLRP